MLEHLKSISQQTAVYGLGQGGSKLLALLALPIFTAFLPPAEFGVIAVLSLVGLGLSALFGLGIAAAAGIVYFERDEAPHRSTTIWTASALLGASGLVLALLTAAAGRPLAAFALGEPERGYLVALYGLTVAMQMSAEPMLLRLQYEKQARPYVSLRLLGAVASVGLSLWLVAVAEWGVFGWFVGNLAGAGLLLLASLGWVGRSLPLGFGAAQARALLQYGYPLIPGAALSFLILNSAAYFVKHIAGLEAAGVFAVGNQLGMGMALATAAFGTAWYPFFQAYVNRPDEASTVFPRLITAFALSFGLLTLLFFVFARPAVMLLAAPEFQDAYRAVGPIAAAQFFVALWSALLPGMYFARDTKLVPLVQGCAAVLTVAAHLLLIPRFGIEGAGLAVAVGAASMVLLQIGLNRWRRYGVRTHEARRLGSALGLLVIALVAQRFSDESFDAVAALGPSVLLLLAFGLGAWLLLSTDERAALRAHVPALGRRAG